MKQSTWFSLVLILCQASTFAHAAKEDGWTDYIDATVGKSRYYLHDQVLNTHFQTNGTYRVLSLGSGAGNEEIDLVGKGFHVVTVDRTPRSSEVIKARAQGRKGTVQSFTTSMDRVPLEGKYDLVMSYFALPYGQKSSFLALMNSLDKHMQPGGVFSANFFGYDHSYIKRGAAYGMNKEEIETLLKEHGFHITYLLHRVYEQPDYGSQETHWDVFDVIAVKTPSQF